MSNSSHLGTPQHNFISPFSIAVKAELNDVGVLKVSSDGNLHKDSQVEDSSGAMHEFEASIVNEAAAVEKEPCVYCGQNSCDWVTIEDDIVEEFYVLEEEKHSNKEIHHHAYHLYTRLKHGVLCKYDQRPLPICVCGEIMDN